MTEGQLPGGHPGARPAEAAAGAEGVRAGLVRQHAAAVMAVCLAGVRNYHEAEDLMQETFTRALAGLNGLREPEKARAWLLQIARRLCIDHARKCKPTARLNDDLPAQAQAGDSQIERLHAALARLPDDYRETISLYYLDGRDCAGVAASLGISPGAVRTRLLRGRVMLYDLLKEDRP